MRNVKCCDSRKICNFAIFCLFVNIRQKSVNITSVYILVLKSEKMSGYDFRDACEAGDLDKVKGK